MVACSSTTGSRMSEDPSERIATLTDPMSIGRCLTLGFALLLSMFLGAFPQYALGVLAPLLVGETRITDLQIGLAASTLYLTASTVAWFSGRLIDTSRSRLTLAVLLTSAAAALMLFSSATSFFGLLLAVLVAGVAAGANNAATNRVIANHVPAGRRAIVLSTKQIGVKIAHMSTGVLIPLFAVTLGWRTGLALFAAIMLAAGLGSLPLVPRERAAVRKQGIITPDTEVKRRIRWLRGYAISMAVGTAAIATYLPLYAVRDVGVDYAVAGLMVTAMGGFSVVTRILWAHLTERIDRPTVVLIGLAVVGTLSLGLIAAAGTLGAWALWVGTLASGATVGSWVVVAHLAIMSDIDRTRSATATGYVQATFLIGLAAGAPVFGFLAESLDSYPAAWSFAAALSLFAVRSAVLEHRRRSTPQDAFASPSVAG